MRKLIIATVTIFIIIAVGLSCLMVAAIYGGGSYFDFKISNLKLVNTQNISLDGIDALNVNYTSDDVVLYTGDTGELIIKEYMSFTPVKDELTKITKSGGTIRVEGGRDRIARWFFTFGYSSRVEIYLPSGYRGELSVSTSSGDIDSDIVLSLSNCEVSCSSGDIKLREIYADNIKVSTSSGDISIGKAEGISRITASSGDIKLLGGAGDTRIATSSGDITVAGFMGFLNAEASSGDISVTSSAGEKEIKTTSGQIDLQDSSGYVHIKASSGDVRITKFQGFGSFETTSGSIKIEYAEAYSIEEDITVKASSGDVTLILPEKAQFNFEAKTSSGDIRTHIVDRLSFSKDDKHAYGSNGSDPLFDLDIKTTSGDIRINEH